MKTLALAVYGLLLVFVIAPNAENKTEGQLIVTGNNEFAFDLYAKLKNKEGNIFFSPFSISTALAMTYAGARGDTAEQMANTLHFDLKAAHLHPAFASLMEDINAPERKEDYQLSVANALWGQKGYGFLKEFLDLTREHYGAGLNELDFEKDTEKARETINIWVERETQDKIKNLIPEGVLDAMTRLVLTNAIYFKGNWAEQFDKELTRDEPFHMSTKKKIEVPTMHKKGDFKYASMETLQALELPYKGNELSMIVLLPKKIDGIADLENSLDSKNMAEWLGKLHKREVRVSMPRFKMTSSFQLGKNLSEMGMPLAFGMNADFSGMSGNRELFISAVLHKAFVDVNEEGTEAAAATGVVMTLKAMPEPVPVFRADHPFIFLIRDNLTESILFIGRVTNPGESEDQ